MQSQYLKPRFAASIFFGLVLANISIEASAQINSLKKFAIEDFSDVGRVKQTIELDPKVMQTAENFRPEGFAMLPGKLLRVSLNKEFVRQGQMTHSATEVVESAKDAPGYFVIKIKETLPKAKSVDIHPDQATKKKRALGSLIALFSHKIRPTHAISVQ